MSWGDVWNFIGDPAGMVTGVNTEGFGGVKKMLFGDPDKVKKAYDDMIATAAGMTGDTRNFLSQQKDKSLAYFNPAQHMLQSAYGTEGIKPPQAPQGMAGLAGMYGVR